MLWRLAIPALAGLLVHCVVGGMVEGGKAAERKAGRRICDQVIGVERYCAATLGKLFASAQSRQYNELEPVSHGDKGDVRDSKRAYTSIRQVRIQ